MAAESTCEFCGAPDPRWLRWLDRTIADYVTRTKLGGLGTGYALHYCEDCESAAEAEYPSGNLEALRRLERDVGRRGLDADDNELRLVALMVQIEDVP